jgi:hypothetical protein
MTALDAGALTDPGVAGIHALQIKVREDRGRQVAAGAEDAGTHERGVP